MADRRGEPTGVAAVVVSYEPDLETFLPSLAATAAQVDRVLVVDNGSSNQARLAVELARMPTVVAILQSDNLGIATALNAGVRRLAEDGRHAWLLTLDQDTVLHERAVETVLDAFAGLDAAVQRRCGVVALAYPGDGSPRSGVHRPGRRSRFGEVGGGFRERRLLITSGNLVRRQVAETVPYEDELFVDQVDTAFSLAVRARGWSLLEYATALMDHRVGQLVEADGKLWRYEPGQRLYYIVRNSTALLLRSQLPPGVYVTQTAGWARAYAHVNGMRALPRLAAITLLGVVDGVAHRMGRRSYPVLAEPRRRRGRPVSAPGA